MKVSTNTEDPEDAQDHRGASPCKPQPELSHIQKSTTCQLQALAKRLGIWVRFKNQLKKCPRRILAVLIRDPNKCVLCGDCVRICSEVQTVGAIDFAREHRRSSLPSFGKSSTRLSA